MPSDQPHPHKIVIVGGGAGGLELVTRLGDGLGRRGRAEITLIDTSWTHVWKPLLHEVAAGSLDVGEHQLEYLAQARRHHFRFRLGRMEGLDRKRRLVQVAPVYNEEGLAVTPARTFPYDTLVIAVGSVSNDFGLPGVAEHCLFLDTTQQAQRFQRNLLDRLLQAHAQGDPVRPGQLDVAIVGGGATGVELAAQLHRVTRLLPAYGLDEVQPDTDIRLTVIQAAPRLVPGLPERLSRAVAGELQRLGIAVRCDERVTEVTADGIRTAGGEFIPAAFKVWAAGIKAPEFLSRLPDLETTTTHQLLVRPTLQATHDDSIFALGDCAACPMDGGALVPPRAQAAHQQASFLARALAVRLKGGTLPRYRYRDYGSLVALGHYSTVGNLMGKALNNLSVSGMVASLIYRSLYQMHLLALHGWIRTGILALTNLVRRGIDPEIKLH
ncbi:MAG: NAD(P)/FAD-dependent oxidoreductase [Gammaproteobacteria bacterium]